MWQYLIEFCKSFNNNEIALIILFFVAMLSFKTLRECIYNVIKYLLQNKFFRLIFLELVCRLGFNPTAEKTTFFLHRIF